MKKIIALLLSLTIAFSLAACSAKTAPDTDAPPAEDVQDTGAQADGDAVKKAEEEAAAKKAEEEAAKKAEEEAAAKKAEEEAAKKAEEEAAAKKAEEEAAAKKAEEEAAAKKAEEEAAKKAEEEAAAKKAEEEAAAKKAEEEAAAKKAEEEAAAKKAEEEAAAKKAEEEAAKKAEEDAAKKAAEEAERHAAEVEAARKLQEEIEKREADKKAAEEAAKKAEEEAKKEEEEEQSKPVPPSGGIVVPGFGGGLGGDLDGDLDGGGESAQVELGDGSGLVDALSKVVGDSTGEMMVETFALSDSQSWQIGNWFPGASLPDGCKIAANQPMIGSIAHVVLLIEVPSGSDAESVAKDLKANANPRWQICVSADSVQYKVVGNRILFVMSSSEIADDVIAAFNG